MKTKKFILSLICICALLLVFVGCNDDEAIVTTQADTTTGAPETEPPAPSEYTIVSGGGAHYSIVRPEDLANDDPAVQAAVAIRTAIKDKTGVSPKLGDDWIAAGKEYDSESFEILVGPTAHPETAQVMASIGYGDCAIRAVGNKIVIFSYTDTGYDLALNKFSSLIHGGMSEADDGSKTIAISAEDLNYTVTAETMTSTLPLFDGGSSAAVANMGDGCYGVVIKEATPEGYRAYLSELTEGGYTTYAENEIAGSLFATLYTSEYTVNAGYYNNIDEVRILIEPYGDDTLPTKKSSSAPITTTQITMLGVEGISGGEYQKNGLCLIYRLSDGSFVIVDGGHSGNSAIYANNILKALREQSAAYAKNDKDIRIAAWIITHPHSDHFGTFVKQYKRFANMNIERVMGNFWDEATFKRLQNTTSTFAPGEYSSYTQTYGIAEEIGADYVVPHVGQVYWFGDTAFEFLYTLESFMPRTTPTFNTSSLVFRTVTADASGKTSTVMVTGDATGFAMEILADTYGEELGCDILQLAHHGSITSGNNNGTKRAYEFMKPSVLFWPVGVHYYETVSTYTYNHVLLEGKNPNYAEMYIAGWQGNSVTLPLPYTVGTAIINKVLEP